MGVLIFLTGSVLFGLVLFITWLVAYKLKVRKDFTKFEEFVPEFDEITPMTCFKIESAKKKYHVYVVIHDGHVICLDLKHLNTVIKNTQEGKLKWTTQTLKQDGR